MGWGAKEYPLEIARGGVQGAELFGSYGERTTAGAETNHVIWPNGDFVIPPAVGVQLTLSSSDAADADGGTGVNSVEIHYLDGDLNPGSETVTLNGLTGVTTTATDIRFVQCMHLQDVGSAEAAVGNISAVEGVDTYSYIAAGEVRCSSSMRMIPKGKKAFVAGAVGGAASGTSAARVKIRLVASELDNHQYLDPLILMPHGTIAVQDNTVPYVFPVPLPFKAGTVIGLTETTDKAAIISGTWFGWIEDDET